MRRDWSEARAKVEAEGHCRRCLRTDGLQAAHVVARSRVNAGQGAEDPRNIVPLCDACHRAQHNLDFELLPLLTREEETYVVSLIGLGEAYRRTTLRAAS